MGRPSKAAQHAALAAQSAERRSSEAAISPDLSKHRSAADPVASASAVDAGHDSSAPDASTQGPPAADLRFDPLLTVDEVALWLRKPTGTLYAWRSRGLGPRAYKVGNDLRYSRAEVSRWLEQNFDAGRAA